MSSIIAQSQFNYKKRSADVIGTAVHVMGIAKGGR
jgi:hypothetical protein